MNKLIVTLVEYRRITSMVFGMDGQYRPGISMVSGSFESDIIIWVISREVYEELEQAVNGKWVT